MTNPLKILTSRGLTPEVIAARGYERYESAGDVLRVAPRMGSTKKLSDWTKSYGARGPGWIMPKWKLPGSRFDDPLPQLRPDTAIPNHREAYVHEHDTDPFFHNAPLDRARHEANYHGGKNDPPLDGEHEHVPDAKYLIAPGPHAKRWDANPLTADRWAGAERVFLHLEGCIKADALTGVGEAAADVPSVTLWDRGGAISYADWPGVEPTAPTMPGLQLQDGDSFWDAHARTQPELEQWRGEMGKHRAEVDAIRQLQQDELLAFLAEHVTCPVIVLCDSDWSHNARVATEAFNLRDLVRSTGLPCVVAAPPTGRGGKKQGTDDYLADRRHKVGGHLVIDPVESPEIADWACDYERRRRADGRVVQAVLEREIAVLRYYAARAITDSGKVERRSKAVARSLGVELKDIQRATKRLHDYDALQIVGRHPDPDAKPVKRTKDEREQLTKAERNLKRQRALFHRREPSGLLIPEALRPATRAVRLDEYLRQL